MSDATQEKGTPPEKALEKMTAKELRVVAAEIPEITGAHGMKKDELLTAIKQAKGLEENAPAKKKTVSTSTSGPMTAKEMKAIIVQLRKDQETLRQGGDRKQLNTLRRRIKRLKKRSRRPTSA